MMAFTNISSTITSTCTTFPSTTVNDAANDEKKNIIITLIMIVTGYEKRFSARFESINRINKPNMF